MQLEFIHAPNEIGDESSRRKIMLGRRGKNQAQHLTLLG